MSISSVRTHRGRRFLLAVILVVTGVATANTAQARPRSGTFAPQPASEPHYAVVAPDDPGGFHSYVTMSSGERIYLEAHLPRVEEGTPLPTILKMTPYGHTANAALAATRSVSPDADARWFAARGYAFVTAHVVGTGGSDGCHDWWGEREVQSTRAVLEHLGTATPWTDGSVGMFGGSYDGGTPLGVASSFDQSAVPWLKAIVAIDPYYGYGGLAWDGVPAFYGASSAAAYHAISAAVGARNDPRQPVQRPSCWDEAAVAGARLDADGSFSPYWREREYRLRADRITVPTLVATGFNDTTVPPHSLVGLFDRIPETTPHKVFLGHWGHGGVLQHRLDFLPSSLAWFDQFVRGVDVGVHGWPEVQVQDSSGSWRAENGWLNDGRPGQLALGPGGALGASAPVGQTTFSDAVLAPGAVFETGPVDRELRIKAQPVVDLWLRVHGADAHVSAELQMIGPDGHRLDHSFVYGSRSLQHLDPMPLGVFEQEHARPVEMGSVVRVLLRLSPTDLVLPAGGRLRLVVSGGGSWTGFPTAPSGGGTTLDVLHDCTAMSALRFTMPDKRLERISVAGDSADHELVPLEPETVSVDGGLDHRPCGSKPADPQTLVRSGGQ